MRVLLFVWACLAVGTSMASEMLHLTTCIHAPTCPTTVAVEGLAVMQQALQLRVERRLPRVKSLPWPTINETHLFPGLIMDWTCCNASRPSDLVFWDYNHSTRHVVVSRNVASETYPDLAEYIMHLGRLEKDSATPPSRPIKAQASDPVALSPVLITLAVVGTLAALAVLGFLLFF